LAKAEGELENVQKLTDSIEFAQVQVKVFEGLKLGNSALKDLHSQMKIEDVENLMMETQEAIAYQDEIDRALSQQLTSHDEEEIEAEYEKLEKESVASSLPNVPTNELPAVKEAPKEKQASSAKKVALEA